MGNGYPITDEATRRKQLSQGGLSMAELYPVYGDSVQFVPPQFYIMIEVLAVPSMCPEFEPGPPEDFKWPEFWSADVTVFMIDTDNGTASEIGSKTMKNCYKYIQGRRERISFWRVMKYLEHIESAEVE